MAKKNWSPRRLEGWIEERLREAIEGVRASADFDGADANWDTHLGDTPWSEMNWDVAVWNGGEISTLLNMAEELDLRISPGLVQRARMYLVQI